MGRLLRLVVVVAVLGLIAAFAIPRYNAAQKHKAVVKMEQATEKSAIALQGAMERYAMTHNHYYPPPILPDQQEKWEAKGSLPDHTLLMNAFEDIFIEPSNRRIAGALAYQVSSDGKSYKIMAFGDKGLVILEISGGKPIVNSSPDGHTMDGI